MNPEALDQRSDEWVAARLGHVTGSQIKCVLASGRGSKESATRANYRAALVAERLTGAPDPDKFESAAMRRGTEQEPFARAKYEERAGLLVGQVGFVLHPEIPWAGCSPDGLVGEEGLVQIKAPNTSTHLETIFRQEIPSEYEAQMFFEMACTGRKWCDFVSFDDRLPDDVSLFVKRLARDDAQIALIETEVRRFLAEVEEYIEKVRRMAAHP